MQKIKEEGVGAKGHQVSEGVAELVGLVRATTTILCARSGAEIIDMLFRRYAYPDLPLFSSSRLMMSLFL